VVLAAMTVGLLTRINTILSLAVVLSYVHRAPVITGPLEPVLTMLLCYLCLGPAGRHFSLDRWFGLWRGKDAALIEPAAEKSWSANLALRLIQVHVVGFYLLLALSQLAGPAWWNGRATWFLLAHADSRIIDLSSLHSASFVLDLFTHAVVLFELAFAVLIWNRTARPLLLLIAVPMWLLLAVISGELGLGAVMLAANLAFVPAEFWRRLQ
jgi:hypothetical protein